MRVVSRYPGILGISQYVDTPVANCLRFSPVVSRQSKHWTIRYTCTCALHSSVNTLDIVKLTI